MKRIVIVYGPQGSGKTPVAAALVKDSGGRLVEEWNGTDPLEPGDVAVTNISSPPNVPGATYVKVKG